MIIIAVAVGAVCHFIASETLVDVGMTYSIAGEDFRSVCTQEDSIAWDSISPAILRHTCAPWPIPYSRRPRIIDLDPPDMALMR